MIKINSVILREENNFILIFYSCFTHEDALIGHKFDDLYPENKAKLFNQTLSETINSRQLQIIEYYFPHEGREHWFEGRIAPINPLKDSETLVIWMADDIMLEKRWKSV